MDIKKVMTAGAECTKPDATLADAARRMKDLDVGSLPVCDNDRLIGMLTDRDIVVRSLAEGKDPRSQAVRDVMTEEVIYCFVDQGVSEVAQIMKEQQIRRLPVLDQDRRLVGIVSIGDLAISAHDDTLVGKALEGISEPARA